MDENNIQSPDAYPVTAFREFGLTSHAQRLVLIVGVAGVGQQPIPLPADSNLSDAKRITAISAFDRTEQGFYVIDGVQYDVLSSNQLAAFTMTLLTEKDLVVMDNMPLGILNNANGRRANVMPFDIQFNLSNSYIKFNGGVVLPGVWCIPLQFSYE